MNQSHLGGLRLETGVHLISSALASSCKSVRVTEHLHFMEFSWPEEQYRNLKHLVHLHLVSLCKSSTNNPLKIGCLREKGG